MFLQKLKVISKIIRLAVTQFLEDGCAVRAAALAYTSLLSLVPLMTVSLTIMSAFPMFKQVTVQVQNFVFQNFVATSAETVQAYLQKFTQQALNLSSTGLLFLLVTAILMVFNMEQAFNLIWHVKRSRTGVSAFMTYWAILTFLPILIGIGFALTSYFFSLPFISGTAAELGLTGPLLKYFPYLLTLTAFTVLYIALPNTKVKIRHALIGGVVATILFELTKFGFGLYVLHFPTYELLYGTLAAVPVFLIWIYVSWLIVLFGAVVAHVVGVNLREIQANREPESI